MQSANCVGRRRRYGIAMRTTLLLAVLAALATSCAPAVPPFVPDPSVATYANPVLDADFPDPAVIKAADGFYYAYATQTEIGGKWVNMQVARSRDLATWQHLGDALPGAKLIRSGASSCTLSGWKPEPQ